MLTVEKQDCTVHVYPLLWPRAWCPAYSVLECFPLFLLPVWTPSPPQCGQSSSCNWWDLTRRGDFIRNCFRHWSLSCGCTHWEAHVAGLTDMAELCETDFDSTWDVLPRLLGPQNIGTLTSLHICEPQNGDQASDPDPARFLTRVYVSVLFSAVWLKEPHPGGGMGLRAE